MKNLTQKLLIFLLSTMLLGCNKNKAFFALKEQEGALRTVKKDSGNFEFGDCYFHVSNNNIPYLALITSDNSDEYVSLVPIKVEAIKEIDERYLENVLINYYSRKAGFIDYILGGEIPYGSFDLFFDRNDIEIRDSLKTKITYLFTLNLDYQKIKNYGGTSLFVDTPLSDCFERSLNFGSSNHDGKLLSLQIPIKNLCK